MKENENWERWLTWHWWEACASTKHNSRTPKCQHLPSVWREWLWSPASPFAYALCGSSRGLISTPLWTEPSSILLTHWTPAPSISLSSNLTFSTASLFIFLYIPQLWRSSWVEFYAGTFFLQGLQIAPNTPLIQTVLFAVSLLWTSSSYPSTCPTTSVGQIWGHQTQFWIRQTQDRVLFLWLWFEEPHLTK